MADAEADQAHHDTLVGLPPEEIERRIAKLQSRPDVVELGQYAPDAVAARAALSKAGGHIGNAAAALIQHEAEMTERVAHLQARPELIELGLAGHQGRQPGDKAQAAELDTAAMRAALVSADGHVGVSTHGPSTHGQQPPLQRDSGDISEGLLCVFQNAALALKHGSRHARDLERFASNFADDAGVDWSGASQQEHEAARMIQAQYRRRMAVKRMGGMRKINMKHVKLKALHEGSNPGYTWTKEDSYANMLQSAFHMRHACQATKRAANFMSRGNYKLCGDDVLEILDQDSRSGAICDQFRPISGDL